MSSARDLSTAPTSTDDLATLRIAAAYCVTSFLLAAAWHVRFPLGLWIVNALGAIAGIALVQSSLGADWHGVFGWSRRNLLLGVALGIGLVGVTQVAARLLFPLLPSVVTEARRLYGLLDSAPGALRMEPIILIVVIAEELVYRGAVTAACARRMSPAGAIFSSTLLYAFPLAASGSWLLVAIGITLGTVWTLARVLSGGVLVSLLSHAIWSCATFVVLPVL